MSYIKILIRLVQGKPPDFIYNFILKVYSILFRKNFNSMIRKCEDNSDIIEISRMKLSYSFSYDNMTKERFIVSANINDIHSGIGCLLAILAPSWSYAVATKRTLVIDWRKNPYTYREPENNLFSNLFQTDNLAKDLGISVIADNSVAKLILPKPFLRDKNINDTKNGLYFKYFRSILQKNIEVPTRTLLPSLQVTFPLRRIIKENTYTNLTKLFKALHPKSFIQKDINKFYKHYMNGKNVIGVHVRHGNGEEKRTKHFENRVICKFNAFIHKLTKSIQDHGAAKFNGNYDVFLCTDSDRVSEALSVFFPKIILSPSWKPPLDAGIDFDNAYSHPDGPVAVAAAALVDIYLLAKCNSVLVGRPTEFVSMVPYIMDSVDAEYFDLDIR